jgi:hypothetical protein
LGDLEIMSRESVSNDRYTLAFGVDHTPMGCFFQLWEKAAKGENPEADEVEQPQVDANEQFGMHIHNVQTLARNPELRRVLRKIPTTAGPSLRNEETIIAIGKACGFDISRAVYKLWD